MARSHARILTAIWADQDFATLKETEQRAYLLAVSQPDLSYAGVLSYTLRRWQRLAGDTSITKLRRAFLTLQERLYVLIDETTEEVWIRSFVKNDGVLTNPNVAKAALSAYRGTHSPMIRGAFQCEMHRLNNHPDPDTGWDKGWKAGFQEVLNEPLPEGFPDPLLEGLPEWLLYARAAPTPFLKETPQPCDHGAASPSGCAACRSEATANGRAAAWAALGGKPGERTTR